MKQKNNHFDCIVIGFGGMGSAALCYAAMSGRSVLGVDLHGPAHTHGSSHGQTRVIRKSYFEHPDYVPLLVEAYERWDELNRRHRTNPETKELLTRCGVLQVGPPEGEVLSGVRASAQKHGLKVESFSRDQIIRRLPILKIPEHHEGVFEPEGGFLRVEICVAAFLKQAIAHGAQLMSNTTLQLIDDVGDGVLRAQTSRGEFTADQMIVTAGSWANRVLPELNLPLKVLAKQQHWYQIDRVDHKLVNEFPCTFFQRDDGSSFYTSPEIDTLGMKVCEHTGGDPIDDLNQMSHDLNLPQKDRCDQFLRDRFQFTKSRLVHHSLCKYTMTPDSHFIIDRHPVYSQLVFAAGFSGHGFKFAPAIGKRLVGLLDGESDARFDFLKRDRFEA
jgi:sarcosine oxidase